MCSPQEKRCLWLPLAWCLCCCCFRSVHRWRSCWHRTGVLVNCCASSETPEAGTKELPSQHATTARHQARDKEAPRDDSPSTPHAGLVAVLIWNSFFLLLGLDPSISLRDPTSCAPAAQNAAGFAQPSGTLGLPRFERRVEKSAILTSSVSTSPRPMIVPSPFSSSRSASPVF